jgi:hypothetical protein
MHPHQLPMALWLMLRSYKVCRTPREEQRHRFRNHEPVALPETYFAKNVDWILRSCLVSRPETKQLKVGYVRHLGLGRDVAIFGSELKISDQYLTYDTSHELALCGDPEPSDIVPFSCDHLVLEVWDNILSSVPKKSQINAKEGYRPKSLVAKHVSQMPRLVRCSQTRRSGELFVTWESNESVRQSEQPVIVELHNSECPRLSTPVINEGDHEDGKQVYNVYLDRLSELLGFLCACPHMLSEVGSPGITFTNLATDTQYFATVSRTTKGSIPSTPSEGNTPLVNNIEDLELEEETVVPGNFPNPG